MSNYLQDRSNKLIAQGALTNSKRPECFIEGVYPTHLERGYECYVWDYTGKKYFDFINGLGCNLLGYAQQDINAAMFARMQRGITLSLSTDMELQLAEKIKSVIPFAETMRFLKTGTDACAAALKIARTHHQDRDLILTDGYHGWTDEFVSITPPAYGVPKIHTKILPLMDNEHLIPEAAAVILEPVVLDFGPDRINWLRKLRADTKASGTLLIFDEIITGFRFPKYCVSNFIEVEPDLILLGKAIANGMPLSVVAGKHALMNCGQYFVSSTFAGETLSIAAAIKTLDLLRTPKYQIAELWRLGDEWLSAFNQLWPEKISVQGYPTRGRFEGDPMVKALFWQEAVLSGLLFGPTWFYSFPLSDKSKITLGAAKDILCRIRSGSVSLKGKLPQSPFADQVRKVTT